MARSIPWQFAMLVPARHPDSGSNRALLGPHTLGIEVTDAALAHACGLGNIDPQHGPDGIADCSAIEAALVWPLPQANARLVTIRPDADAFGAMAVLLMRQRGMAITGDRLRRVLEIAQWDRFDLGCWQDWQRAHPPLPRPAQVSDLGGAPLAIQALSAIATARDRTAKDKVLATASWLAEGLIDNAAAAAAQAFQQSLIRAWNAGEIVIETFAAGRAAHVRSVHAAGLRLGYRMAPVVLAEGQVQGRRKLTVAQFAPGHVDMKRLLADLTALESGWGGSPTIIGSPQGAGSGLSAAVVIDTIDGCMQ